MNQQSEQGTSDKQVQVSAYVCPKLIVYGPIVGLVQAGNSGSLLDAQGQPYGYSIPPIS